MRLTADPLPGLHDGAVRWQGATRGQERLRPRNGLPKTQKELVQLATALGADGSGKQWTSSRI